MNATATFQTEQAVRHLATLCNHFARKVPVTTDAQKGHVAFPFGQCDLSAHSDSLELIATASDQKQLEQLVEIVTRHLERFAFRENPQLIWEFADA